MSKATDLWKLHIRSDVPPPPEFLLDRFVAVVLAEHNAAPAHRINSDNTVAVATDYYWQPIETCPRSVKVQLLGAGGVAHYGQYHGETDTFWTHWAPLPKKPPAVRLFKDAPTDAEERLTRLGYDLNALEKDNPHNQWMKEQ